MLFHLLPPGSKYLAKNGKREKGVGSLARGT